MNDKEKAQERFTLNTEDIRVTFIPQCCRCKLNTNRTVCEKFSEKEQAIINNENM